MANHRLIHKEAATGQRTTDLDELEFRVWVQYLLSADDFGVCPATAVKLQGDNRRLAKVPTKKVQAAINQLVAVTLVQSFDDHGMRYLYQWDWQDWQRLKHASTTSFPPIPGELLEKCSPKTVALLREFHPKIAKVLPPRASACDALANANAVANASGLEESPRETKPGPLLARGATLAWDTQQQREHAGCLPEHCRWRISSVRVCFPATFVGRFSRLQPASLDDDPAAWVLAWVRRTEADPGYAPSNASMFEHWQAQWNAAHGDTKPTTTNRTKAALQRFVSGGGS
jgi:hypothetical protein